MINHCCLLHLDCWREFRYDGMPMRLYFRSGRQITLLSDRFAFWVWGKWDPLDDDQE